MTTLSKEELTKIRDHFKTKLENLKNAKLSLDLTRGKPSSAQLDLSNELDSILKGDFKSADGTDTRNYGGIDGIPEAKELFSQTLGVPKNNVLIGGNSSLTLMYNYAAHAALFGVRGSDSAWKTKFKEPKFLCPSPGYDRHFAICESLGIKMQVVKMNENGPDMDQVESLLKSDDSICGMWCVPKYSNPTGCTYSKEVVTRISNLHKIANPFFRVLWDNAYALHDLENNDSLENVYDLALKTGGENSIVIFGSTSKISFAGAGVSFLGTGNDNLKYFKEYLSSQTIGPDKVNQLKHVRFFKNHENLAAHMKKHAEILIPKFKKVTDVLEREIGHLNYASWTKPNGGYFISLDTQEGLAKAVVNLCAEVGVKLTPAGSTYPYGKDPKNCNIRIAPSMPSLKEIELATETLAASIGYLTSEKLLG